MTTLRVIVDQLLSPVPGGIGRYAHELTRAMTETTPEGWDVAAFVSASSSSDAARVSDMLPGIAAVERSELSRRALSLAWQYGIGPTPHGPVHATSLLAPARRGRRGVVVTIHDAVPWTHPETLTSRGAHWHRAMAMRAARFADVVVAPSQTVATELDELLHLGDRVAVIGGAVGSSLRVPVDADARASALRLPDRYLLSVGTLEPRKGLDALIRSLGTPGASDLPLLVVGQPGWGGVDVAALAREAGVAPDRVRVLGRLSDADLAVALERASVFVFPSRAEGFGLPVVEAFSLGTPVVHSDAPAILEVSAGAGIAVARDDAAGYPVRLAEAIATVAEDSELAARLSSSGLRRARAFDWHDSARKVWELHTRS